MKTTDFDAQRKALHEKTLRLMHKYADDLESAMVRLQEAEAAKKLTHSDIEAGLRMLGLGLQRVSVGAELRDGKDIKEPPKKAGSRLKRLRIIG